MTEGFARYDYAWKTEGWTVQNPEFDPELTDTYTNPGLPDDVSKVKVFGKFRDHVTGRFLEGVLQIRTSSILVHGPTETEVMPGVQKIRFRRGGFNLLLAATDDPDLTPAFQYEARLTVNGRTRQWTFSLPATDDEVNILNLLPDESTP